MSIGGRAERTGVPHIDDRSMSLDWTYDVVCRFDIIDEPDKLEWQLISTNPAKDFTAESTGTDN